MNEFNFYFVSHEQLISLGLGPLPGCPRKPTEKSQEGQTDKTWASWDPCSYARRAKPVVRAPSPRSTDAGLRYRSPCYGALCRRLHPRILRDSRLDPIAALRYE